VSFHIRVVGVEGGNWLRISNDGIVSWNSHGTRDSRINHLSMEGAFSHSNDGQHRLFPNVIDFRNTDVRRELRGQWGQIDWYEIRPDYVEFQFGHGPAGACDFEMDLTVEADTLQSTDGLKRPWHVKFYTFNREEDDPNTKEGWERIVGRTPVDEQQLDRLNFCGDEQPSNSFRKAFSPELQRMGRWNDFATVATREWDLPAGTYEVHALFDDEIRVFVDGQELAQNPVRSNAERWSIVSRISLAAGKHQFRIEHFETWGDARLKFSFRRIGDFDAA
jgi:hypothetical protein